MPSVHAGKQMTIRLSDDEIALLARLAKVHGTKKAAILAGMRLLEGGADIDMPAALERAAAEMRRLQRIARFAKKG